MIVTVTANPSVDRTYRIGALKPGTLHRATNVTVEASGKGVNVSRVLAQLGVPTRMVLTAGGPEGRLLSELLRDLPADIVEVAGHTRINVTVVSGDEPTKINEPGAPLAAAEAGTLVAAVEKLLPDASWLAVCGSLPPGTDPDLVARLIATGRAQGVPVAVDSSGAALAAAVTARADLVKPNTDELAELSGAASPETAARQIQRQTGGTVLATLGGDGALLITPDGGWHAVPPPITPINTTGAGDALLAGYLGADRVHPAERLAYAVAIGTSACLVEATAGLPAARVPPSAVDVRPLAGARGGSPPTPRRRSA